MLVKRLLIIVLSISISSTVFAEVKVGGEIKTTSAFNKLGGVHTDQYSITNLGVWALGNQGNGVNANFNFKGSMTSQTGIVANSNVTIKSNKIPYSTDWTSADFQLTNAHISMQGFIFSPGATVWAGIDEDLKSIHILDWVYRKFSGLGFGMKNYRLGDLSFDINLYDSMRSGQESDITYNEDTNPDLGGYYHIMTLQSKLMYPLPFGNLEFEVAGHYVPSSEEYQRIIDEERATNGVQAGLYLHTNKFFNIDSGYTEWAIQAGYGLPTSERLGQSMYMEQNHMDAISARVVHTGLYDSSDFQIMTAAAAQYDMNIDADDNTRLSLTAGARPVLQFDRNMALMGEYGFEYLKDTSLSGATNDEYMEGTMHKVTGALAITLDSGFWSRPQIRLFSTFVTWDPELNGISNPMDVDITTIGEDRNMAVSFGINMEVWY